MDKRWTYVVGGLSFAAGAMLLLGVLCWLMLFDYRDAEFLRSLPTEQQVLDRFGKPMESLSAGETFRDTGWQPVPEQPASPKAYSFMRMKTKVYVFIGKDGRVQHFVQAGS